MLVSLPPTNAATRSTGTSSLWMMDLPIDLAPADGPQRPVALPRPHGPLLTRALGTGIQRGGVSQDPNDPLQSKQQLCVCSAAAMTRPALFHENKKSGHRETSVQSAREAGGVCGGGHPTPHTCAAPGAF